VSASSAVKRIARHERTGSMEPALPGRPPGTGKLAPYRAFLIGCVKEKPDITMPELAAEPPDRTSRRFAASRGCMGDIGCWR
jgi:hypothetical protein